MSATAIFRYHRIAPDVPSEAYLDLDEPEQAEHYMGKAQEIYERAGIDADALMVLPYLA